MNTDTTVANNREQTRVADEHASCFACERATALPADAITKELGLILHDLNNVFVSILLNAQVIEWKLPSYSRIKRNVHEVERSAQRGAVLVKRISQRVQATVPVQPSLVVKAEEPDNGTAPEI